MGILGSTLSNKLVANTRTMNNDTISLQLLINGDLDLIHFDRKFGTPLASPKYDGMYCRITEEFYDVTDKLGRTIRTRALSRSGSYIPNANVRNALDRLPAGLHGELVTLDENGKVNSFSKSMSELRSVNGSPNWKLYVFNYTACDLAEGYAVRMLKAMKAISNSNRVELVEQVPCHTREELESAIANNVFNGHEGTVCTYSNVPYLQRRCNRKQPYAVRFKDFTDAEFVIADVIEEVYHDCTANRANRPELIGAGQGYAASFICEPAHGFTEQFRAPLAITRDLATDIWNNRASHIGKQAKVRWLSCGVVNRPRLPVCSGLRED